LQHEKAAQEQVGLAVRPKGGLSVLGIDPFLLLPSRLLYYKAAYCLAVCPAGEEVIAPYLTDKSGPGPPPCG
jgi:hypothetical protein